MRHVMPMLLLGACAGEERAPEPPERGVRVDLGEPRACPAPARELPSWHRSVIPVVPVPEGDWTVREAGFAVADLDGDRRLDLVIPSSAGLGLWLQGEGRVFEDRTAEWVDPSLSFDRSVGASAADADADGDPDVFVFRDGRPNRLLRNEGDRLVDVTEASGLGVAWRSISGSWADYDGDGLLDLAVGTYDPQEPTLLWRNLGGLRFEDRHELLPPEAHGGFNFMTAWHDLEGDGFPELFVPNDYFKVQPSVLLANRGGVFAVDPSAGYHPNFHGMGIVVADVDGDLLPDVAESTFRQVSLLTALESPLAEQGVLWVDSRVATGLSVQRDMVFGWGVDAGDLENDGDLDLAAAFGHFDRHQPNPEDQPDGLWRQGEDGRFEFTPSDPAVHRGLLLVDLDGDGWLDLLRRDLRGGLPVDWGACGEAHWTEIELDRPRTGNPDGIGARITVEAGGRTFVRWVEAGSRSMFVGGPPVVHVGLADAEQVERLVVDWPDGRRTEATGLPVDRRLTLTWNRR